MFFRFRISRKFDFLTVSFRGVKTLIWARYDEIWRLKLNIRSRRTVVLWTILAFSAKLPFFVFWIENLDKNRFFNSVFSRSQKTETCICCINLMSRTHFNALLRRFLIAAGAFCSKIGRKIDFGLKILKKVELFFWSLPNSCTIKNTSSVQIRALKVILRRLKLIFWSHFVWKPP